MEVVSFALNSPLSSLLGSSASKVLGVRKSNLTSKPFYRRKRACVLRPEMLHSPRTPSTDPEDDPDLKEVIETRDWREFRAALVVGSAEALEKTKEDAYRTGHWAHALALPEQGCFLASHPAYYRRAAPYLTQSVVFITKYEANGEAVGLVLNRPLRGSIAELEKEGMFGRSSNLSPTPLATQPVYIGGPDGLESGVLTALHGKEQLRNDKTQQPLDGVFVGEVATVLAGVESGCLLPEDARLFAGCIRWGPGALEREVDEGMWYCISASPLFALKHCIQLPKPLWVEIMQCQGKPFAQIARQVYNEDDEQPKD